MIILLVVALRRYNVMLLLPFSCAKFDSFVNILKQNCVTYIVIAKGVSIFYKKRKDKQLKRFRTKC